MEDHHIIRSLIHLSNARISSAILSRIEHTVRERRGSHPVHSSTGRLAAFFRPCLVQSYCKMAVVGVLIVMIGGAATFAAAQAAMPGHTLYQIKLATESIAETVARGNESKIRLHTELAQRRAEEVAVLKMRVLSTPGVREQRQVEQALVKTTQRLGVRIGQVRAHLQQKNIPAARAETNVASVREQVSAIEEALREVGTVSLRSSELHLATEEARRELFELKAAVEAVTMIPEITDASAALDEAKTVQVIIVKARAKIEWHGIPATVGIDADVKTMGDIVKEAEDYFNRGKYPETYSLATTAVRMGEKVLREFDERGAKR